MRSKILIANYFHKTQKNKTFYFNSTVLLSIYEKYFILRCLSQFVRLSEFPLIFTTFKSSKKHTIQLESLEKWTTKILFSSKLNIKGSCLELQRNFLDSFSNCS
jgi:hypothetical protein